MYVDAFIDTTTFIACTLHLERRMGLKILTMLLEEGQNGYLVKSEQVSSVERIENRS
jgi:hypothetical protein